MDAQISCRFDDKATQSCFRTLSRCLPVEIGRDELRDRVVRQIRFSIGPKPAEFADQCLAGIKLREANLAIGVQAPCFHPVVEPNSLSDSWNSFVKRASGVLAAIP